MNCYCNLYSLCLIPLNILFVLFTLRDFFAKRRLLKCFFYHLFLHSPLLTQFLGVKRKGYRKPYSFLCVLIKVWSAGFVTIQICSWISVITIDFISFLYDKTSRFQCNLLQIINCDFINSLRWVVSSKTLKVILFI